MLALIALVLASGGAPITGTATPTPAQAVTQGVGYDGGAWRVYIEGQAGGGGSAVVASQSLGIDGGSEWNTACRVNNFPATQPVSIASMPSTPVTGTFWQATQPVSGSLTCSVGTVPVTGTFWQATQPVSLASMPSTPVTGTFWQATQPVSIATAPALVASSAVIGHVINDASSAVIGHVIADTGSTTAVTGTVTVGTHAVTVASGGVASGAVASGAIASGAVASGAIAAGAISGSNPCINPTATILGLSGATSGTASVQLVALSGSTKIYVCSMNITGISGTTPKFSLTYGTGSACATGTVTMVGSFTTTANTVFNFVGPTFAVTAAGQALCYVQTGTTPVSNYNITYVQQ